MTVSVGFTGTRFGMTPQQKSTVYGLTRLVTEAHLGDCVGVDQEVYEMLSLLQCVKIGHPPDDARGRAFCRYDVELPPEPYLERNKRIVEQSHELFAVPRLMTEEVRSGTWQTVRYARRIMRPVTVIWPDGTVAHS